ncbi:MAG: hypothetical protein J6X81_01910 [Muribaculaceae bacterium]|nr:hypothetical protein [Muribaculaceae bacterium]
MMLKGVLGTLRALVTLRCSAGGAEGRSPGRPQAGVATPEMRAINMAKP